MTTPFSYRFDVRLHDTDTAGVMFFAHLLRHAHDAYEAFLASRDISLATLIEDGVQLPIVHCDADYRGAMRLGDTITVTPALAKLGGRSFTLRYRFIGETGNDLAVAQTVHVTSGSSLPSALLNALNQLPSDDE